MADIIIRPGNPYDFTADELSELLTLLRSDQASESIEVELLTERGYGVSPWEIIEIIGAIGGAAETVKLSAVMVHRATAWARERWQKDRSEHPNEPPRPRGVRLIYGPDGSVLRAISIDLPDGEPTEEEPPSND